MRNAAAVAVSEEVGNIAASSVGTSCCPRFTDQTTTGPDGQQINKNCIK